MPSYSVYDGPLGGDYNLEEGLYQARLIKIEDAIRDPNAPPSPYGDKDQWTFAYHLKDDDGNFLEWADGTEATKREWVTKPNKLTTNSKLYERFSALLNDGQPLSKERQWEVDDLVGVDCQIYWGPYVGADGTRKFKIQSVSAPKKKAAAGGGLRSRAVKDQQMDPDEELAKL